MGRNVLWNSHENSLQVLGVADEVLLLDDVNE